MCRATGRAHGHQRELAADNIMPVALTDMRLTKLEVLGSPDRIESRGRHTATDKQEEAILEVRDRTLVRLPGKTRGEEVKSKQGRNQGISP